MTNREVGWVVVRRFGEVGVLTAVFFTASWAVWLFCVLVTMRFWAEEYRHA